MELLTIMSLEEERYREVLRKGSNLINQSLKSIETDAEQLPDELLFQLNDSHGLPPDMVISMARRSGWNQLRLRTGFSAEMAERHAKMAKAALQQSISLLMLTNCRFARDSPSLLQRCPTT